jgi:hypothetical protein
MLFKRVAENGLVDMSRVDSLSSRPSETHFSFQNFEIPNHKLRRQSQRRIEQHIRQDCCPSCLSSRKSTVLILYRVMEDELGDELC